jgi:hypothetical protein
LTGRRDNDILANNCTAKEANMQRGRVFALILVVVLLTSIAGCSSPAVSIPEEPAPPVPVVPAEFTFVITVTGMSKSKDLKSLTGSDSVKFSGNYMTMTASGSSTSQTVEGTVPATYETTGSIVSCEFQNMGEYGWLDVTVTKDGAWAGQSTTSAAYGVVTVATQ